MYVGRLPIFQGPARETPNSEYWVRHAEITTNVLLFLIITIKGDFRQSIPESTSLQVQVSKIQQLWAATSVSSELLHS